MSWVPYNFIVMNEALKCIFVSTAVRHHSRNGYYLYPNPYFKSQVILRRSPAFY